MHQLLKLPEATSNFKFAICQKPSPVSTLEHCGNKCSRPRWESRPVDILVTGMLWVWRAFVIKGAYKSILLTAHQLLFAFHRRCIWDNSLPVGFYWPANGFLLCLNATWNQPIHELDKFLGWECGTWHITVQYFFAVREVKQMIDLVGQLTMGNLAHDEGSLVTSPEGTSWVIWFGAMTVIGSRC